MVKIFCPALTFSPTKAPAMMTPMYTLSRCGKKKDVKENQLT
jgi:hypothetical protein